MKTNRLKYFILHEMNVEYMKVLLLILTIQKRTLLIISRLYYWCSIISSFGGISFYAHDFYICVIDRKINI